jgi:hypothetical protein
MGIGLYDRATASAVAVMLGRDVMEYGKPGLFRDFEVLWQKWLALGRPAKDAFEVEVCFGAATVPAAPDTFIIMRRSVTEVIRYVGS